MIMDVILIWLHNHYASKGGEQLNYTEKIDEESQPN
jgi:hypothetical protein